MLCFCNTYTNLHIDTRIQKGNGIMNINLIPLNPKDRDIINLMLIHNSPSVAKYISVSDRYFDYVTSTDGVVYYKVLCDNILAGGLHCEHSDGIMFISICIDEKYRRHGIAEAALNQLFLMQTDDVNVIEVSIDETNLPSLFLFKKLGFSQIGKENELIKLRKLLH